MKTLNITALVFGFIGAALAYLDSWRISTRFSNTQLEVGFLLRSAGGFGSGAVALDSSSFFSAFSFNSSWQFTLSSVGATEIP
jgi:hypothetical protein